jgi:phosphate acetyltransferase
MRLNDLRARALKKAARRLNVLGAVDRGWMKPWEERGWKINYCSGDWPLTLHAAVEAATASQTDLICAAGDDYVKLIRAVDRSVGPDQQPVSVLLGFEIPTYPKLLWIGQTPMGRYESVADSIRAVQMMIRTLSDLGEPESKVALLSCVETVTAGVPSTVWEAALAQMSKRGQFGKARVDGPLGFDLAVSLSAVEEKGFTSDVGGKADLLITPDLNSFVTLADALRLSGPHEALGLVIGGPCPIALPPAPLPEYVELSLLIASLLT